MNSEQQVRTKWQWALSQLFRSVSNVYAVRSVRRKKLSSLYKDVSASSHNFVSFVVLTDYQLFRLRIAERGKKNTAINFSMCLVFTYIRNLNC